MKRDYQTLDAIVVIMALLIVGGTIGALILFKVPENNLPIISSLVSALLSAIISGYAGFRWGSSMAGNHANETAQAGGNAAIAAVAQLAGAGPRPPLPPTPVAEKPNEQSGSSDTP